MGSNFTFRVAILLVTIPSISYSLNVDLRAPGYSMEHVRLGNQYGGTCYAESAAMAMDAYRYSWLGYPTNTFVDSIHLGMLESIYMENQAENVSENERDILKSINAGSFDPSLLNLPMEGGFAFDVIQRGMEHGFCVNVDQTHSILTRFGDQYDVNSSFKSFYTIYNYYQHSQWNMLKYDWYIRPEPAARSSTYVQIRVPFRADIKNEELNSQKSSIVQRKIKETEVFIKDMAYETFDQRFTEKDRVAYAKFLKGVYASNDFTSFNSLEFLDKLTEQSCKLDSNLKPSEATTAMYYYNEDESRTSDEDLERKKNIVHQYLAMAKNNKMVQPLVMSYCVDQTLNDYSGETCGHHASLIVGIVPNKKGTHDLILRNTDACSKNYEDPDVVCSKDGDYYVEENKLLCSIRILFSVVPTFQKQVLSTPGLSAGLKEKLTLGYDYMEGAQAMQLSQMQ